MSTITKYLKDNPVDYPLSKKVAIAFRVRPVGKKYVLELAIADKNGYAAGDNLILVGSKDKCMKEAYRLVDLLKIEGSSNLSNFKIRLELYVTATLTTNVQKILDLNLP